MLLLPLGMLGREGGGRGEETPMSGAAEVLQAQPRSGRQHGLVIKPPQPRWTLGPDAQGLNPGSATFPMCHTLGKFLQLLCVSAPQL